MHEIPTTDEPAKHNHKLGGIFLCPPQEAEEVKRPGLEVCGGSWPGRFFRSGLWSLMQSLPFFSTQCAWLEMIFAKGRGTVWAAVLRSLTVRLWVRHTMNVSGCSHHVQFFAANGHFCHDAVKSRKFWDIQRVPGRDLHGGQTASKLLGPGSCVFRRPRVWIFCLRPALGLLVLLLCNLVVTTLRSGSNVQRIPKPFARIFFFFQK